MWSSVRRRSHVLSGVLGLLLAGWGERTFAAEGTEILPASPTNKKLVTRGPFRYTRNPMYLGLVLMAFGFALYFGTLPFYVVPVLLFLLCNFSFIPFEEAKMQRAASAISIRTTSAACGGGCNDSSV